MVVPPTPTIDYANNISTRTSKLASAQEGGISTISAMMADAECLVWCPIWTTVGAIGSTSPHLSPDESLESQQMERDC